MDGLDKWRRIAAELARRYKAAKTDDEKEDIVLEAHEMDLALLDALLDDYPADA